MISKNQSLIIRVQDFNLVAQNPALLKQLRKLTLSFASGLKKEIANLISLSKSRPVKAQALLAYYQDEIYQNPKLVGWALLSKEESAISFPHSGKPFYSSDGYLFEVYIHYKYRRQGIGSKLLKIAKRKAQPYQLCVAPWDDKSLSFYQTFKKHKVKWV